MEWLERLERGEVSRVTRHDVDVELTPVEIERRIIKYGDFSQQNQKINTERSETTHKRFQENQEELLEYWRQLAIKRPAWSVDPLIEIIARVRTMSSKLRIGDFCCGSEAKLMIELGPDRVISFDHLAIADNKVIECDMKSVSQHVEDGDLEVVLFCLSLMGKNWDDLRNYVPNIEHLPGLIEADVLDSFKILCRRLGRITDNAGKPNGAKVSAEKLSLPK